LIEVLDPVPALVHNAIPDVLAGNRMSGILFDARLICDCDTWLYLMCYKIRGRRSTLLT